MASGQSLLHSPLTSGRRSARSLTPNLLGQATLGASPPRQQPTPASTLLVLLYCALGR